MRRIRVKNKYLIVMGLLLITAIGVAHAAGGDYLFSQAEKAMNNQESATALAYYDKLISEYPNHPKVAQALYLSSILLPVDHQVEAVFFPHHSSRTVSHGGVDRAPESGLTREERLWRIYHEYPEFQYINQVQQSLGDILVDRGDLQAAEQMYRAVLNSNDYRINSALALIDIYLAQARLSEAWDVLQIAQTEMANHLAVQQQFKKGDILAAMGDYAQAKEAYEEVVQVYQEEKEARQEHAVEDSKLQAEDHTLVHYQEMIERKLGSLQVQEESPDMAEISGQVFLLGQPLSGVEVLLREVYEGRTVYYSPNDDFTEKRITNQSGEVSFSGIVGASYEMGIVLNDQQLSQVTGYHLQIKSGSFRLEQPGWEAEFHFVPPVQISLPTQEEVLSDEPFPLSWSGYPGATRYRITSHFVELVPGGYQSSAAAPVYTRDNHYLFTEPLQSPFGAVSMDRRGVSPLHLIGTPQGGDGIVFRVEALDDTGRVISSSSALYFSESPAPNTFISFEGIERDAEQQLLLDRQYDAAVEGLEERLKVNPNDLDALKILSRVYFSGTYNLIEDWSSEDMAHQDIERSRKLIERLIELDPQGNHTDSLITVLNRLGERERVRELYQQQIREGSAKWIAYNTVAAHLLSHQDDYEQAFELYLTGRKIAEGYYAYHGLLGLQLLTGQTKQAQELLGGLLPEFRGDSRFERLVTAIVSYGESGETAKVNHLQAYQYSLAAAKARWQQELSALDQFLLLIADLTADDTGSRRANLRERVNEFTTRFKDSSPQLTEVIEALAQSQWI